MATTRGPFDVAPPDEIRLARAPLASVLAQVRHPKAPALASEVGAQHILERLRKSYPILRQVRNMGIVVDPSGGVTPQASALSWSFTTKDGQWILNVGDESTSLQTTAYSSREDFCARLDEIFSVVGEVGDIVIFDRLGVRYTNQLDSPALEQVDTFFRQEFLGGVPIPLGFSAELLLTLTDISFAIVDGSSRLRVRSGLIPPHAIVDPGVMPKNEKSWLFDLDSFVEDKADFEPTVLGALARILAERAYRLFRWAVTPDFLTYYGATTGGPNVDR